jgi:glucosylceramidase
MRTFTRIFRPLVFIPLICMVITTGCMKNLSLEADIFETSAGGHKLTLLENFGTADRYVAIEIFPEQEYQTMLGFGGSFTEASASLLNQLSAENRSLILEAYFGASGARYSLTRTHINSCDFSLGNYSYAPVDGDTALMYFSGKEDHDDLIPMIKDALKISPDGFRIIASPWTAPPWMKDNKAWRGGRLLPQYYDTWALFISKYLSAYQAVGINIFGLTVENEPLGNDSNWESMHYTPQEMNDFVVHHLKPLLRAHGHETKILGFDQNRDEELIKWVDAMYSDEQVRASYDGTATHWYASTFDYFPDALEYVHKKAPEKLLIQTEACIDAEIPRWKNDAWYWSNEATDWGYDWAPAHLKHLHPPYVPAFRYARDIIGCMNHWVEGWIDWNMVLNRQGGPNWAKNWCIAPVIVDEENDEVYFTPLYYVLSHFSKFIRPGAVRIGFNNPDPDLMVTAVRNPDGSIVVIMFNPAENERGIQLAMEMKSMRFSIGSKAIQTILIQNPTK